MAISPATTAPSWITMARGADVASHSAPWQDLEPLGAVDRAADIAGDGHACGANDGIDVRLFGDENVSRAGQRTLYPAMDVQRARLTPDCRSTPSNGR